MLLISLFQPNKNGSLVVSRYLRKIFEKKNIKVFLGIFLALIMLLFSLFENPGMAFTQEEAILNQPSQNSIHTETTFQKPINGYISQTYHWFHPGIDICASLTTPIYPVAEGTVGEAMTDQWGYGHKIIIDHDNGYSSLYAHLDKISVEVGQKVDKNTEIGTIGLTGWTTGPHLHLEIYKDGKTINPQEVLPDFEEVRLVQVSK